MNVNKTLGNHGSNDYDMHKLYKALTHVYMLLSTNLYYSCYSACLLLCETAQQLRALMMNHETLSMISMMLSQCPISCVSETSQVLSPVLFLIIAIFNSCNIILASNLPTKPF